MTAPDARSLTCCECGATSPPAMPFRPANSTAARTAPPPRFRSIWESGRSNTTRWISKPRATISGGWWMCRAARMAPSGPRWPRAPSFSGSPPPAGPWFAGSLEGRDADRMNARPASIWRADLGGRIPIQRVLIMADDGVFSRPFQLEAVDDPAAPVLLASGGLTRRENTGSQLAIEFAEQFARRLRLTVTDDRNAPLNIAG